MPPKKASKWTENYQLAQRYHHAMFNVSHEDMSDVTLEELERKAKERKETLKKEFSAYSEELHNCEDAITPDVLRDIEEALGLTDVARSKLISDLERKAHDRKLAHRRSRQRHARRIKTRDIRIEKLQKRYTETVQTAEATRIERDDLRSKDEARHRDELASTKHMYEQMILELRNEHNTALSAARDNERQLRDQVRQAEKRTEDSVSVSVQSAKALADLQAGMSASTTAQQQWSADQLLQASRELEKARADMKRDCDKEKEEIRVQLEHSKREALLAEKTASATRAQARKAASDTLHRAQLDVQRQKHEFEVEDLKAKHRNKVQALHEESDEQEQEFRQLQTQALQERDRKYAEELAGISKSYDQRTAELKEKHEKELSKKTDMWQEAIREKDTYKQRADDCSRVLTAQKEVTKRLEDRGHKEIQDLTCLVGGLTSRLSSQLEITESVQKAKETEHEDNISMIDLMQDLMRANHRELKQWEDACVKSERRIRDLLGLMQEHELQLQREPTSIASDAERQQRLQHARQLGDATMASIPGLVYLKQLRIKETTNEEIHHRKVLGKVEKFFGRATMMNEAFNNRKKECKELRELLLHRSRQLHIHSVTVRQATAFIIGRQEVIQQLALDSESYRIARDSIWPRDSSGTTGVSG